MTQSVASVQILTERRKLLRIPRDFRCWPKAEVCEVEIGIIQGSASWQKAAIHLKKAPIAALRRTWWIMNLRVFAGFHLGPQLKRSDDKLEPVNHWQLF
jgi:hypothetical protein